MMDRKKVFCIAAFAAATVSAALEPASIFNHGMVLQRGRPVPVWGKASPGAEVAVDFGGARVKTKAGPDGKWRVSLPAMEACREGRTLSVSSPGAGKFSCTNVVVGEVWLCSGQSNMAMPMWGDATVNRHGSRADNGYLDVMIVDNPDVRGVRVPCSWSTAPKEIRRLAWAAFAPGRQRKFSAVAFHYALALHEALKVPVGVIQSAWGGTLIEPWTPAAGFAGEPALAKMAARPVLAVSDISAGDVFLGKPLKKQPHQQPRAIYNAMIHPLVPFAVRGTLWYQGESNRRIGRAYEERLRALHSGWAVAFENPDMPFYIVQLAPYGYMGMSADGTQDCEIWEAQAAFAKSGKNRGMVTIPDAGDVDNIHPGDKRTVALRLAALALNRTYGRKDVPCDAPELKSRKVKGGAFELEFANCASWVMHGTEPVPFEIAGADGKFVPAECELAPGGKITVKAPGIAEPKALRYAWNWRRSAYLKNEYGLPLGPFRILPEKKRSR